MPDFYHVSGIRGGNQIKMKMSPDGRTLVVLADIRVFFI
jgi:hypothetical protein